MTDILLMEGFDLYNGTGAAPGVQGSWNLTSEGFGSGGTHNLFSGSLGGQRYAMSTAYSYTNSITRSLASSTNQLSLGIRISVSTITLLSAPGSSSIAIFQLMAGASVIAYFGINNVGQIEFEYNGTRYTTATQQIYVDQEVYVEIEVDGVGGTASLYVNDILQISATGGMTAVDTVQLKTSVGNSDGNSKFYYFDDFYVISGSTRLHEQRILVLHPNADTATKEWTPSTGTTNYTCVNDILMESTTYVSAPSSGVADEYDLEDLTIPAAAINGVQITSYTYKSDSGVCLVQQGVDSGGTISMSADLAPSQTGTISHTPFVLDPNGNIPWTQASVDALKLRMVRTS
jgi:hypothetical protein